MNFASNDFLFIVYELCEVRNEILQILINFNTFNFKGGNLDTYIEKNLFFSIDIYV
jgi:hypothetical protein